MKININIDLKETLSGLLPAAYILLIYAIQDLVSCWAIAHGAEREQAMEQTAFCIGMGGTALFFLVFIIWPFIRMRRRHLIIIDGLMQINSKLIVEGLDKAGYFDKPKRVEGDEWKDL